MSQNINTVILNHFASGGGAAAYLRELIPDLPIITQDLFTTRSDIKRVQIAETLSEKILNLTDFGDLVPLRDAVATLEVKRLIKYGNQTDHTAHTVYLFLLGIWVYDCVPELKKMVNMRISSSKKTKMFIFQWIFASLLHDVGYLLYENITEDNKELLGQFDVMFTSSFIPNYLGNRLGANRSFVENQLYEFNTQFEVSINHLNSSSPKELLYTLDSIPWIDYLGSETKSGLDLLISEWDTDKDLRIFAEKIATEGYKKDQNNPRVDHAIASGLMLLKYTSVWYWLYKKIKDTNPRVYIDLNKQFEYPEEVFKNHVIPACRAVIYHNVDSIKFDINKEPLLYLAVLCDELQLWDRFWVGEEHISNWNNLNHCMAEQVGVELINDEANFNKIHFILSDKDYNKINNSLDKRLENWKIFIQLTARN